VTGAMTSAASAVAVSRSYSLEVTTLGDAPASLLSEWQALQTDHFADSPMHDPEWLRGYFDGQENNVRVYSLYEGGRLCGFAPFLCKPWPVQWHLGELRVAQLPLTRLRLLGEGLAFPSDRAAYDLLFQRLTASAQGFDALYLEEVPVDSFLWKYLEESQLIRNSFLRYAPEKPSGHPLLRFEGGFEDYMGKFSSKHRKNLRREVKRMREGIAGPMTFTRYERPEEIALFLDLAVEVSRKTYQWTLHQRGLSATDLLRKRLLFAAEHGWMRSYLLFCAGAPVAFLLGYQYKGRYLFHEIGFDPEFAKYSAGTVLQLLAIEDMFDHDRPDFIDFGDYGNYKDMLSTESYEQGKLFLFRRSAYSSFVRAGHQSCQMTTRAAASFLERMQWKHRLKKLIRGWNNSE
jgi:hypothetical protein